MRIFDATLATLQRSMDVRLSRQNVLGGNLANIDTPGFVPSDVDFAASMAEARGPRFGALNTTNENHLTAAPPEAGADVSLTEASEKLAGLDGNQVDLDRTMAALAENAIQYGAAARVTQKKLALLKYVASDGTT